MLLDLLLMLGELFNRLHNQQLIRLMNKLLNQ